MRIRHLVATTAVLVLVPASAALAHPAFNPNAVPIGEPVESTLVIPHGCAAGGGMPDGDAVPTVRFDLGYTDQVTIEPQDVDGWDTQDDGEAVVWTDAGGATTDPIELPVTLTVTQGAEGDQLFLPAFQECEDGSSFRWVATPGQDGDPAVKIELTAGETGTVEVDDDDHDMADMDPSASPTEAGTEPAATGEPATDAAASPAADAAAMADEAGISGTMGLLVAAVAALVLLAGVVAFRRRGSA